MLILLFLMLFLSQLRAACPIEENISLRGITLRNENDSFAKTDRNYSHGMALIAESHEIKNYFLTDCLPLPLRVHASLFDLLLPQSWIPQKNLQPANSVVVKFGQVVFTPVDPVPRELIINDRPYAGLLYMGMSLHQRHKIAQQNIEVLDTREITVGIIGPLSFAKEFQDSAHDLLGDRRFQGWGNQLGNEPAVQLAVDKKFKDYHDGRQIIPGFSFDFIQAVGLRIGNIESSANVGIESRIGWDLPNDFGSFTVRPGTESRPPDIEAANGESPRFGFHIFTILDVRYVGYNFSVDGNLFPTSHRVTRQPWVSFGAVGLSFPTIVKRRAYNFAIMQVYQTSDFREREAHHAYRSLALSAEF